MRRARCRLNCQPLWDAWRYLEGAGKRTGRLTPRVMRGQPRENAPCTGARSCNDCTGCLGVMRKAFEPSCPCMGAQPSMPRRPAPPHPAHEHLQWQSAAVLSLHFHVITHVCQSACLKPNCCQRAKGVRSLFARQPTGSQWASLSSRLLQCTPDHSARCCQRLTLPRIWEVAQPNTPHNATPA